MSNERTTPRDRAIWRVRTHSLSPSLRSVPTPRQNAKPRVRTQTHASWERPARSIMRPHGILRPQARPPGRGRRGARRSRPGRRAPEPRQHRRGAHLPPLRQACRSLRQSPSDDAIDMHVMPPADDRPRATVITSGMSRWPMQGAPENYARAELVIALPPDWPLEHSAFEDERNWWPLRLLQNLSHLPHHSGGMAALRPHDPARRSPAVLRGEHGPVRRAAAPARVDTGRVQHLR